jgi:hypothetical protein
VDNSASCQDRGCSLGGYSGLGRRETGRGVGGDCCDKTIVCVHEAEAALQGRAGQGRAGQAADSAG